MTRSKKTWKGKGNFSKSKEKISIGAQGDSWVQELKNERFEQYYRAQCLMSDDEWPIFMKTLREPLPTTFRLAGNRETVHELNDIIRATYAPQLSDVTFEGVKVPPPIQIPWYPESLAWQLDVPKSAIRRSPEFKRFHNFLVYETDVGNISRQEAVSMVPPLFLDVKPHHIILDMCAAPGSKTAQLLEAMHAPSTEETDASHIPQGLLIANDNDFKRTHLLVHQSSRLPSPAFMVTNLDASNYPNILIPSSRLSPSSSTCAARSPLFETLKFDRILCDVPCSGDGTLRKNISIWGQWQPMDANGLHCLQLRILLRAMKLLKPAGRIVYSTCSLNPVENEAVVAAALIAASDFELVDVSSHLPSLVRKPGLEAWFPVVDRDLNSFPSYSTFINDWKTKNQEGEAQLNQIKMVETHWPPSNVSGLNLTRCLRIYPHLQDMGGFFVAVLRRKNEPASLAGAVPHGSGKRAASQDLGSSAPDAKRVKEYDRDPSPEVVLGEHKVSGDHSSSASSPRYIEPTEENELRPTIKHKNNKDSEGKFKESPFTFLEPDHPQLQQTIDRLSLLPSFPTSNIFVRNPEGGASTVPLRSLYLCNDIVKRIILANDYTKLRLVAAGTKVFTRQDTGGPTCGDDDQAVMRRQFRILDDAVPVVLPFIPSAAVLPGRLSDLKLLLEAYYPLILSFEDPFRSLLSSKENGNHLIRFHASEENGAVLNHPLVLPLWKSNVSLSLMIDKKSKSALSLRVFGQDVTIFGKQMLEKQIASQGRREAAAAAKESQVTARPEQGIEVDGMFKNDKDTDVE